MSIADGWLDWAERRAGVPDKVYSAPNLGLGIVCHSQEGYRDSIDARFLSRERDPADPSRYSAYAAASTMFYNPFEGPLVQYYPVTASTWTSGNAVANTMLWAVESEGMARRDGPLNANQVANLRHLIAEWEAHTGDFATRDLAGPDGRTLWQHNEVWHWAEPNAGPTACPSHRYDPFFAQLEEEEMDLRNRVARLERIVAGHGLDVVVDGKTRRLTGDEALAFLDGDGASLALGLAQLQALLREGLQVAMPLGAKAG